MGPIRRDRVKIHTSTILWRDEPVAAGNRSLHLPSRVAFRDSVREVEAEYSRWLRMPNVIRYPSKRRLDQHGVVKN
jgi:hypothetical protein